MLPISTTASSRGAKYDDRGAIERVEADRRIRGVDLWRGVKQAGGFGESQLTYTTWPCNTPLPNIEHTLNGCMLFETLGKGNLAERLNATKLDSYKSNSYILVYSTIDGMNTALMIEGISTRFQVMGSITGSEENDGNELRVATFTATARESLKAIFP